MADEARNRVITPQSLQEVLAQAVQATKSRPYRSGARPGVTGLPRSTPPKPADQGKA
jgi:hypothetical protein